MKLKVEEEMKNMKLEKPELWDFDFLDQRD
jgi:hypothetical protein